MSAGAGGSGAVSEAVARVEAELNAFWSASNEGDEPKARASTMNFVAVGAVSEVERLRGEVEQLAETRAGRVFLMTVDGRLPAWEVGSDVSAVCHKEGDTVICYDRIELTFGAMAAGRVGSMLGALGLPEVPTIVEAGHGAPAVLLDPLALGCDRLIVDSMDSGVTRIAELARKTAAPIGDRAFVRTFSWRDFVARFFDDAGPAARAITRVVIEWTEGGRHDPAALLLGWLGSRLGWTFEGRLAASDARGVAVGIEARSVPAREHLGPGEITAIHLEATLDGAPLSLSCARTAADARTVAWSRSGARSSSHEHAVGFRDEGWVLLKCIDSTESDRVYREALLAAAEWRSK